MPTSLSQKLKIREGSRILTINAPEEFREKINPPPHTEISSVIENYDQVHWFVKDRSEMEKGLKNVLSILRENIICWIYYPKATSGFQTDLTRDKGWDALMSNQDLQWLSLISFDDTWSSFAIRLKRENIVRRPQKPVESPVLEYIDRDNKTVLIPSELSKAFKRNKSAAVFFNSLSFTNKKEYVEWVISAKKPQTRETRISESIERLNKGWKNPSNR